MVVNGNKWPKCGLVGNYVAHLDCVNQTLIVLGSYKIGTHRK